MVENKCWMVLFLFSFFKYFLCSLKAVVLRWLLIIMSKRICAELKYCLYHISFILVFIQNFWFRMMILWTDLFTAKCHRTHYRIWYSLLLLYKFITIALYSHLRTNCFLIVKRKTIAFTVSLFRLFTLEIHLNKFV